MANLAPQGPFRAFDDEGNSLSGGKLYTYEAGTSTLKTTYTDETATTPNTNPVILDSAGYADVWLGDGSYKFILKDSDDVTLWTVDDIVGAVSSAFGASVIDQSTNLTVTSAYANYFINCTDAITLSLGAAADLGEGFLFTAKASNGAVVIDPDGSELIDGASSKTLATGTSALIICNGTVWYSAFYSSGDFSGGTLILPQSSSPSQTAEGSVVWDTDDDLLTVGDGSGRKVMVDTTATQTITGAKTFSAGSTEAGFINLAEDSDNGSSVVKLQAPAALTSDRNIVFPDSAGTVALTSDLTTFTSGTYTPTLYNTTNIAASTSAVCNYYRLGNYVTVFGQISIDPTATGVNSELGFSIPVASNFAAAGDAGGTAASVNGTGVGANNNFAIVADSTNDRVSFRGDTANAANLQYNFSFTYIVQ